MAKLEKYWEWKFNIEKFLRDYPENKRNLEDKKEALAEIAELKTQNYDSPPGTPGRGDKVTASAQKAEKIRAQIEEYQEMIDLYERAYDSLTREEKLVIKHLYHVPNSHMRAVNFLADKVLHCDRSTVYRISRKAKDKIREFMGV